MVWNILKSDQESWILTRANWSYFVCQTLIQQKGYDPDSICWWHNTHKRLLQWNGGDQKINGNGIQD